MLVESVMSRKVVTTRPGESARGALMVMHERRIRHLPVVAQGVLVGIVSDRDVEAAPNRLVEAVMHRQVVTITPDTPVEVAAGLMLENKIGSLPVLGGNGTLVGIVTETDLFRLLARVLGAQEPGTRLQIETANLPADLATVAALANDYGVPISSIVSAPAQPGESTRTVILRVRTIYPGAFVSALRAAGIQVDAPESVQGGVLA